VSGSFIQRWARLKQESAEPSAPELETPPEVVTDAVPHTPRLPTFEDVGALGVDSDYTAFMAKGVDKSVQRLAMKKLFTDPHFNVMDGLDIYIDDYNLATPVSATMLAALGHAQGMLARGVELQARTDAAAARLRADARTDNPPAARVESALPPPTESTA
jgi:hypothetical protein